MSQQKKLSDNKEWILIGHYAEAMEKVAALQADLTQMTAWGRGLETELRLAKEEIAVLQSKVTWLMKADRLVCWNGKEWETRLEVKEGGSL